MTSSFVVPTNVPGVHWHEIPSSCSLADYQSLTDVHNFMELYCPLCRNDKRASFFGRSHLFPSIVMLCCSQCQHVWYFCKQCCFQRSQSKKKDSHACSYRSLKKHVMKHKSKEEVNDVSSMNEFSFSLNECGYEFPKDVSSFKLPYEDNPDSCYTFSSEMRKQNSTFYKIDYI